jgi:hypothetical protein
LSGNAGGGVAAEILLPDRCGFTDSNAKENAGE